MHSLGNPTPQILQPWLTEPQSGPLSEGEGYFIEPLYYLAKKLNFTAGFRYSVDGKWGGRDGDSGEWNGMIGMLISGEADLATAALGRSAFIISHTQS